MSRILAPAGSPIAFQDLVRWPFSSPSKDAALGALRQELLRAIDCDWAWPVSSGRAAITEVLRTLHTLDGDRRRAVIIPAYTCYSVPAAVLRAGLVPRAVDVDPKTLGYCESALMAQDTHDVLAVLSANLYGIPNDLVALERFARDRSIYMVDDAAQALGASIAGRYAGTFGDVGVFSFDRGKCITTVQGGLIATKHPRIALALERTLSALPQAPLLRTATLSLQLLAYSVLLRPRLYWLPNRYMQLGVTRFELEFPITQLSTWLASMVRLQLRRLHKAAQQRRENALQLRGLLAGFEDLMWPEQSGGLPVYTRLPVLLKDGRTRDAVLGALAAAGLGGSRSYPLSVADLPQVMEASKSQPMANGGRDIARRILTLPTHPYVSPHDREQIVQVVREHLSG